METFYTRVVNHRRIVIVMFSICFAVCLFCQSFVSVNYDMNDYLPQDAQSTVALREMQNEFDGGIPNARVMIRDVTIPEALEYKEKIEAVEGVTEVTWLDDAVSITTPIAMLDADTVRNYYKDNTALFNVTIEEDCRIGAVESIREIIGGDNAMTGSAVSTALATISTVSEVQKITVIAVLFTLIVLLLTTESWVEPLIILMGLGVAVVLNNGSNLMFGEISFVTNAAGSILQMAVSLDYSVFLIHRFEECRKETGDVKKAMVTALCKGGASILSSGLTTVIGFIALVLMRFRIGPDLGIALAKGVAISLITVFLFMPAFILATYKWLDKTRHKSFMPDFGGFGKFVLSMAIPIVSIFAILILPSYLAAGANAYYFGSSRIYGDGTTYGRDRLAIESVFGKKDTYVLLVPKGSNATEIELSKELRNFPQITEIISYVDTVGAEIPIEYLDADTLSLLQSEHYSRFVITAEADYEGDKTFSLVEQVRETAEKYYPGRTHLAGEGVSTYDLMDTITADMAKVNLLAVGAVFAVLLLTMKSVSVPVILVLCIETAIWINLSVPYFSDEPVYYIAYLIISSVQLGATVDYAILMTDRYKENRSVRDKKEAAVQTISDAMASILTSGSVLTVVGLLLGYISTNRLLAQLGIFIGRGAIFSLAIVLLVLPGLLLLLDGLIVRRPPAARQGDSRGIRQTQLQSNKSSASCRLFGLRLHFPHCSRKKRKNITGGNKMMKHRKRIMAAFLAVLLMTSVLPVSALAMPNLALQSNTPKEEVVYINLNADGSVKEINIVNIFDLDEGGEIIDYGKYESVRNMTTTDIINYQNGMVTIDASVGKLYYEGRLGENVMPWTVSIKYFMDGKEYSADEIAGMSGRLGIKMSIRQNGKCDSSFFEGYALQVNLTLDTGKAANITADGATIANVGSDKQLTYTILPNKGAEIEIAADVTDFEMDGMAINGIPLNMDIKVDDAELMERIADLQEAIGKLDDGTGEVYDGVAELRDGVQSDLKSGVSELQDGASKLQDGVSQLRDGGGSLQSGAADLKDGASSLDEGMKSLNDGIIQMQNALTSLNAQSGTLRSGSSDFKAALGKLQSALDGVSTSSEDVSALTAASSSIKGGLDNLVSGISELQRNVGFEAYKVAMGEKGLDIDGLRQKNNDAADNLNSMISSLQGKLQELNDAGIDTSDLESQLGNMGALSQLLQANNASITGTESYLTAINQNLSELLAGATRLKESYVAFDAEIIKLTNALSGLAYQMSSLTTAVDSLVLAYQKVDGGITDYTDAVAQIVAGYSRISDGAARLVAGSSSLVNGTQNLYNGTGELLSGIEEVYNGTGALTDGTGKLDEGVAGLLVGIVKLYDGTGELKDGTSTFKGETAGLDTEVREKIDELLKSITGGDMETVSFASANNTNIDSVQFVIQTPAIKIAEKDVVWVEPPATLNFWQKLLRLFDLYNEN